MVCQLESDAIGIAYDRRKGKRRTRPRGQEFQPLSPQVIAWLRGVLSCRVNQSVESSLDIDSEKSRIVQQIELKLDITLRIDRKLGTGRREVEEVFKVGGLLPVHR